MWKSDRWVTVGIIGSLISLALLLLFAFTFEEGEGNEIMAVIFILMIFFTGYIFGGFRSGIKWIGYSILLLGCAFAAGIIIGILKEKMRISLPVEMIIVIALYIIIISALRGVNYWIAARHRNKEGLGDDDYFEEDEIEEYPIGEDFIFLIQPEWFKPDRVYKLIYRNGNLYFCRVGGQFYEIDEIQRTYNIDSSEEVLLKDRFNYSMDVKCIKDIIVKKKQSSWTGHIPNNGTLKMRTVEGKIKRYILHPINGFEDIKRFFESRGIDVEER